MSQFVKFVIIDKNSPDLRVYEENAIVNPDLIWNVRNNTGVVSEKDFKIMAKLIVGAPSSADPAVFVNIDYMINPETGEVIDIETVSDCDFMQMVYDHRAKLVEERKAKKEEPADGCEYTVLFSLLDFLQNIE